jgi:hypothetical protein
MDAHEDEPRPGFWRRAGRRRARFVDGLITSVDVTEIAGFVVLRVLALPFRLLAKAFDSAV